MEWNVKLIQMQSCQILECFCLFQRGNPEWKGKERAKLQARVSKDAFLQRARSSNAKITRNGGDGLVVVGGRRMVEICSEMHAAGCPPKSWMRKGNHRPACARAARASVSVKVRRNARKCRSSTVHTVINARERSCRLVTREPRARRAARAAKRAPPQSPALRK